MRKLLVVALAVLLFPVAASAHGFHPRHFYHGYHQHTVTYHPQGLKYVAADDENCFNEPSFDMHQFMTTHNANVFRYIVPAEFSGETYQGVPCVQQARSEGYKTQLAIAFNYTDTPQQVRAEVKNVLAAYGPEWAVTIGNEESIATTTYLQDWNAAEPVLAKNDPTAIRVGGDAYPWSIQWSKQIIAAQPVGLQAWALHCYDMSSTSPFPGTGIGSVPQLAAFAAHYWLPLMCSEMAPASKGTPLFSDEPTSTYNTKVQAAVKQSPNLEEVSYYVWPSIGADTYGVAAR